MAISYKLKSLVISALVISMQICFSANADSYWKAHAKPALTDGFDSKGWAIVLGGTGLVALSQNQDIRIRGEFSDYRRMNEPTAQAGDFLGTGIPGAAIALSQLFWLDQNNGAAHAEALFMTFATTDILKHINRRHRPDSDNRYSMPSGHTSTAFATATSLAYAYGWKAAVPAYSLASFVAVSRWSRDAHWFSDTVAGALIGIFWGRATHFHHVIGDGQITPMVAADNTYGLQYEVRF